MTRSEALDRAQEAIGYRFKDESLLVAALTHASIANTKLESNERLEFLGDSILGVVVCEHLFRKYPGALEGELTKIKSVVVSRKVCADIADRLGVTDSLFLGKGMTTFEGLPMSVQAAVFESLIAAVFLDGGLDPARALILEHLDPYVEEAAQSENQENYKSHLQQHAQKYLSSTPQYESLDEQGPDHSKCFEVCVTIDGRQFPSAWGSSKKEAEQRAAMLALETIQQEDLDNQRE